MLLSIPWDQYLLLLLTSLHNYPVISTCICLLILLTIVICIDYCLSPNEIPHIFSIPGELPFIGHLYLIIDNPALIYLTWSELYQHPIFQIRIGNKRVVVVNSYEDTAGLWINHSCQNNSRPLSYTFHGLVSAIQGFTIGSTPASLTFSKKKKTISQCLKKSEVDAKTEIIDNEIKCMIREVMKRDLDFDIYILPYFQKFTLKSAIFMSYGIVLDCYHKDAKLSQEIIDNESNIIRLRSPISNFQDSIPILRYIPCFNNSEFAQKCGDRRNNYMKKLFDKLQQGLADDDSRYVNSILGQLILSNNHQLNDQEIQSICLTLVSAGLDNTPLNLNYLLGVLSQPRSGKSFQTRAIEEILDHAHGDPLVAWEQSNQSPILCRYVEALILETLRNFTVLPLSLPRQTSKPIYYKEFMIPEKTHLFMNAYAANHDAKVFKNPFKFDPDRWLGNSGTTKPFPHGTQQFHFAFGAGSRMCSGYNLVMKEMYMMVIKLLLIFEIEPPNDKLMELNPFANNSNPRGTSFEPRVNYVKLSFRKFPNHEPIYDIVLT
ncbi:phacA Phenylacetate 2-hydroxylase [Candida maltosa Xu316]|uniref:Putative phenylacetate hydroxylase P450 n=1 Tax=Candida maltosa (strain Xu316) TaxID=1245528 RepID=M3JYY2_CANMX|nr:putative phenylacetate hydroxylase P450 [Candida maltosa Xu316]